MAEGDSDAGPDSCAVVVVEVDDGVPQALGDPGRFGGVGDAVEDDDEFVAADAGDGVAGADHSSEAVGNLDEEFVACGVAAGVVDEFEAVEIDEAHGEVFRSPVSSL